MAMNISIDKNIIYDVLCGRPEYAEDSAYIWKLCEINQVNGFISSLSIPEIVYKLRKELDPYEANQVIEQIYLIFHIADLRGDDLKKAEGLDLADYEQAVQSVSASRSKADYIITHNVEDYKNSKVKAIRPADFLGKIRETTSF